jgi:hypothetical protein
VKPQGTESLTAWLADLSGRLAPPVQGSAENLPGGGSGTDRLRLLLDWLAAENVGQTTGDLGAKLQTCKSLWTRAAVGHPNRAEVELRRVLEEVEALVRTGHRVDEGIASADIGAEFTTVDVGGRRLAAVFIEKLPEHVRDALAGIDAIETSFPLANNGRGERLSYVVLGEFAGPGRLRPFYAICEIEEYTERARTGGGN